MFYLLSSQDHLKIIVAQRGFVLRTISLHGWETGDLYARKTDAPDDDGIAVLMGGIRRTVIPDAFNRKGAAVRPGDGCRLHIAGGIKNRRNTDIDSFNSVMFLNHT